MAIEVAAVDGAGHGERTPDREYHRNGRKLLLQGRWPAGPASEVHLHGVAARTGDDPLGAPPGSTGLASFAHPAGTSGLCIGLREYSKRGGTRLCAAIDERVQALLSRPLQGDRRCLWLEATHVEPRRGGPIVSMAVIMAVAVDTVGRRVLRGITVMPSETAACCADFVRSLTRRGRS